MHHIPIRELCHRKLDLSSLDLDINRVLGYELRVPKTEHVGPKLTEPIPNSLLDETDPDHITLNPDSIAPASRPAKDLAKHMFIKGLEGKSFNQTAKEMGLSRRTVMRTMHNVRNAPANEKWKKQLGQAAVEAIKSGLTAANADPIERANLGIKVLTGLGQLAVNNNAAPGPSNSNNSVTVFNNATDEQLRMFAEYGVPIPGMEGGNNGNSGHGYSNVEGGIGGRAIEPATLDLDHLDAEVGPDTTSAGTGESGDGAEDGVEQD